MTETSNYMRLLHKTVLVWPSWQCCRSDQWS